MTSPRNTNQVSSVHEERLALGQRLRELRQQAGLTGRQLAEALSWPASKVSKLENARQSPSEDDIRGWTQATGNEAATESVLALLRTLETRHGEWDRLLRGGLHSLQDKIAESERHTRLIRAFEPLVVPGLLQTAEYARARLAEAARRHNLPEDPDDAVRARMRRQEILYRPGRRFHFVMDEAALRVRKCPPEVMLGQLDRLIALAALPTVQLGIVGFDTAYTVGPRHGFWLFDNDRVSVETYSAELNLTQEQEIKIYTEAFEAHAADASYGRAARAIIQKVIDDLAPEEPEEEP
ncbi:helix-turn-helix domain-containing protein [Amycolatopsis aidingensis]|uniref:helix-turn-helix domain-containing protein n=1 Tax=Amycolatopsis aidingensis TaxID=2842453 RepID=UPI001C0C8BB2|nr:helix-turn-helix transcriptional regulator [Amycolatopsis aidingensis]